MSGAAVDGLALRSRFAAAIAGVTVVALVLRAAGLGALPPLGDEWNAGVSAVNFLERGEIGPLMWHHPRLRDLLVYAGLAGFGMTKIGLSLPSLAIGVASVPLVGLLARRVAGPAAGIVAAALVALDPLHVDYSRQAIQDVYMCTFGAAGVLLALAFASSGRTLALAASGVAFGLGLASKWAVVFPLAVTGAWLVSQELRQRGTPRRALAARLAFVGAGLGVLPATVYLLTWLPWFAGGRDLHDWVTLHRILASEVRQHAGFGPYVLDLPHSAWAWFVRPVWFPDFTFTQDGPVAFIAVTNPVVWLATLPGVALLAQRAWRARHAESALVVAAFAATWLPFALASRPIWLHSALAAMPFAFTAVGALVARVAGTGREARIRVAAYLTVVALTTAPLFLLATGRAGRLPVLRSVVDGFRPDPRFEGVPARGAAP